MQSARGAMPRSFDAGISHANDALTISSSSRFAHFRVLFHLDSRQFRLMKYGKVIVRSDGRPKDAEARFVDEDEDEDEDSARPWPTFQFESVPNW